MAKCGNCGEQSLRIRTLFDRDTRPVREYCILCAPEEFVEQPVTTPSDKKVYHGWDAMPNMYRIEDGVAHAKDELLQDSVDLMNRDDEAIAMENKRRTRRTEPMTEAEIARAQHWGNEHLRPAMEKARLNRQYGHTG